MILPQEFEKRMQDMLGEAYPAFRQSYEENNYQALRVNPLKTDKEAFFSQVPFTLTQVAWEPNGYYYQAPDQPGKHAWHEAGVYYIQEPSAMAPVGYLAVQPGERVLDLCAAPGGKSTQIAAALQGEGFLLCNEIHPQRARILSENVERMGVRNALVTNEAPQKLAQLFPAFFDKILVDAPCSGEGMFRKHEEACEEWSLQNVEHCAQRQEEILDCAAQMLRAGGRMVYSTCTFAPAENEGSISRFLQRHEEFSLLEVVRFEGMTPGRPEWAQSKEEQQMIERTIRLWPHELKGEGHFLAVMQKQGDPQQRAVVYPACGLEAGMAWQTEPEKGKNAKKKASVAKDTDMTAFLEFCKEALCPDWCGREPGNLLTFGEQLYLMPKDMPALKGIKVLRPGLHLGTFKKNRFEPSHALALALRPEQVQHVYEIGDRKGAAEAYLQGQTLTVEQTLEKGWYLMTVNGYSIGWGKLAGAQMKNHYPKGLRK